MQTHRFIKEYGGWYIDLPQYLEQGGSKGDLAMVEGADTMLDYIAAGDTDVVLSLSETPFEGADELKLEALRDPVIGGGYYLLDQFEGKNLQQRMWLCGVTEFVFGKMPDRIYVRRERNRAGKS
ncbi:hypothetical protein SAMN05444008_1288 [Cnuella takakiae]|uniref:Uncharacterized protein n=1 Tax=Cnuella takakiae TaxID=1302690 RepID=A0A1M5J4X6_9BACT|nr:DUF6717 family protein [Cnuella takakiae]OLY91453.1 hypothetical protein BUE76_05700 [Cnuella takakiae]SHG35582.1 hypothetical protein SAMN05444008_1288 [Cnuella takakiae]